MTKSIAILGSTGSVGTSTLDVVRRHPDRYRIYALTAHSQVEKLVEQAIEFLPDVVVLADEKGVPALAEGLKHHPKITIASGINALIEVARASESELVVSAIVGAAGLSPTLAAVEAAKTVLIANKEPLVMTGELFVETARRTGATLLPLDSEHNAIFQCLPAEGGERDVKKLHLTASGGPFRGRRWESLSSVTPAQACAHPNWSMGQKISVDSATMMNKGLELIEATALFSRFKVDVDVIVHPQSIIHSLVEYVDGSFLAQLGAPDMRIPIAHALGWPQRIVSGAETLDLAAIATLEFSKPALEEVPCLALAISAAKEGGAAPVVLNAANEVAVEAFLAGRLSFTDISNVVADALERADYRLPASIDDVLNIDNEVRVSAALAVTSSVSSPIG